MRKLLAVLKGEKLAVPPVWLMRQAGRYLPEYRELRKRAENFVSFCLTPDMATEVTLQPVRRFDLDAAILFADILLVPHALGQDVRFVEGEGPKLAPVRGLKEMDRLSLKNLQEILSPVAETVRRVRQALPDEKTLIGFCGSPFTVACYMVEGEGGGEFTEARLLALQDPAAFQRLMDLLVEASVDYLSMQIEAGADAVQLFDSWAGILPEREFVQWVIAPTVQLVRKLKERHPQTPIIGFPRGGGAYLEAYVKATGVDGLGCDTTLPVSRMAALSEMTAVQGNLDPLSLVTGGEVLRKDVEAILAALSGGRFIFNLGHGVIPRTPPEHVAKLVSLIRGER